MRPTILGSRVFKVWAMLLSAAALGLLMVFVVPFFRNGKPEKSVQDDPAVQAIAQLAALRLQAPGDEKHWGSPSDQDRRLAEIEVQLKALHTPSSVAARPAIAEMERQLDRMEATRRAEPARLRREVSRLQRLATLFLGLSLTMAVTLLGLVFGKSTTRTGEPEEVSSIGAPS